MVLGIYCAGGFGGVVLEMVKEINSKFSRWDYVCFIDDYAKEKLYLNYDVMSFETFNNLYNKFNAHVVIASGEPLGRKKIYEKVKKYGFELPNIIDGLANIKDSSILGEGNIIQDFTHISPSNVVMTFSRIAHDSTIGSHCVFASSTNISGECTVMDCSYIGTGAKVREKVKIHKNSIVGMGAVVTKDVDENNVVVGNPAKILRKNSGSVFKGKK